MYNYLKSVDQQVGRTARRIILIKNQVDKMGRDQQDHKQSLWVKALEAGRYFDKRYKSKSKESRRRYVSTTIMNYERSVHRKHLTIPEIVEYEQDCDYSKAPDTELVCIQRDILQRIQTVISKSYWCVLMEYADADLNASEAWRLSDREISERQYRNQVLQARNLALKAWQKIEKN